MRAVELPRDSSIRSGIRRTRDQAGARNLPSRRRVGAEIPDLRTADQTAVLGADGHGLSDVELSHCRQRAADAARLPGRDCLAVFGDRPLSAGDDHSRAAGRRPCARRVGGQLVLSARRAGEKQRATGGTGGENRRRPESYDCHARASESHPRPARAGRNDMKPRSAVRTESGLIGFVTTFFDTLGIGNFATTTSAFKIFDVVPDELIPGTLNVGFALPTIAQAIIYMTVVDVDTTTLWSMIGGAVAGAWLGAGVVARLDRKA